MRSSKSRSRSKSNRNNNRQVGNIVNRVFDSSGPEGKVRGTPQQIIDKYNQLARDAQLSGDRVALENFQQHAEHYLRMLAEALREQQERQAQQQQNQQNRQQNDNNQGGQGNQQQHNNQNQHNQNNNQNNQDSGGQQPQQNRPQGGAPVAAPEHKADASQAEQPDVIPAQPASDTGLVETPEDKPQRTRRPRRKAEPKPKAVEAEKAPADDTPPPPADAAE